MKRQATGGLLILLLLCGEASAADPPRLDELCVIPDALEYSEFTLPHVAARIKANQLVRIVVMGSASSVGTSAVSNAYPDRLAQELAKRIPKVKFDVVNLSKRGLLSSDMERRFSREIYGEQPALVIWQTGTVDAVKGIDVDNFGHTLAKGLEGLHDHGIDVILMDMQYSPHTSTALNVGPYMDYMRWQSQLHSAILFERYAMMKYWEEADVIDFSSPSRADQTKYDDIVHGCIAHLLAEMIENAVKPELEAGTKP